MLNVIALMGRLIQMLIQFGQRVFARAVAALLDQSHQAGPHAVADQRLFLPALVDGPPLGVILPLLPGKPEIDLPQYRADGGQSRHHRRSLDDPVCIDIHRFTSHKEGRSPVCCTL